MGVWNQTCMVTQLPICAGEPVRMILMRQRPSDFGYTEPNEGWKPIGLPIRGEYDEYGSIEGVDTGKSEVAMTLQILSEELGRSFANVDFSDTSVLKNLGHFLWEHPRFVPSLSDPDQWVWFETTISNQERIKLDEQDQLVNSDRLNQARVYGFALVKEEVYQRVIALLGNQRDKFVKKLGRYATTEINREWQISDFLYNHIYGGELLMDKVGKLVEPLAEFMTFYRALAYGRKQFAPQCGQGMQEEDWEYHRLMAQITVDIASREALRRDEDEDQDDYTQNDETEETEGEENTQND